MRAVDANVLVRLLVNDEPDQTAAARQAVAAEPNFVSKTVVVELEWALRSLYDLASSSHADSFLTFDTRMRRRASLLGAKPPVFTP